MRLTHSDTLVAILSFLGIGLAGCGGAKRVEHSVPVLVQTLKEDKDPNMRYWAADSLGKLGSDAKAAVPDLIMALKDESKIVRAGAAYALGEVRQPEAVSALQETAKDPEKEVRDAASFALKQIQQKGKKR
jgi:HEAT repeat protein